MTKNPASEDTYLLLYAGQNTLKNIQKSAQKIRQYRLAAPLLNRYSTDTESLTKGTKTFSKRFLIDFERLKLNAKRAKKNIYSKLWNGDLTDNEL